MPPPPPVFTPGSRPGSRGSRDPLGSFLRTRSSGADQFSDLGGPGGGREMSDEGVMMTNVPSPREYGDQRV
jgi:hypothetical protein